MLWDAKSGEYLRTFQHETDNMDRKRGGIKSIAAFSPDSRLIATSCWQATVHIWDVYSGESVMVLDPHEEESEEEVDKRNTCVSCLSYSKDSRFLAVGSTEGLVRVWDGKADMCVYTLKGHADEITAVAFISKRIVAAEVGPAPNPVGRR